MILRLLTFIFISISSSESKWQTNLLGLPTLLATMSSVISEIELLHKANLIRYLHRLVINLY